MTNVIRTIFSLIDNALCWAIRNLYVLIVDIANVDVFGDYIYEFMDRIYTFLAIFMIFKLSISMVTYILNPDQFTDKSKGFGKIIQNVIIVIALIIAVPQIFNWAYGLQTKILDSNVLFQIVTGRTLESPSELNSKDEKKIETGYMLSYSVYSTFLYNDKAKDDSAAATSAATNLNGEHSCYAVGKLDDENNRSYKDAYDCLFDSKTYKNSDNEYKVVISTVCLAFVAYVFVIYCFDVALRSVKLGVLQLMAPIPIISRLDPNSGKSGMFSKWLKECYTTFLGLFIRLLGIYLAIELISGVASTKMFYRDTNTVPGPMVKLFIILGLLMFAKQLPQLIHDITGIKMDGDGLSLKKKVGGIPLAGKPLLAGAGLTGRTAKSLGKMGGRYLGKAGKFADKKLLGGFFDKTGQKIHGWKANAGQGINNALNKVPGLDDARRTFSEIGSDAQSTFYGVTGGIFGGSSAADRLDDKVKRLDGYKKFKDQMVAQADFDTHDLTLAASGTTSEFLDFCNDPTSSFRNASVVVQSAITSAASKGGTKALKKVYEDLQASGTASMADITAAREAWEKGQELVIDGKTMKKLGEHGPVVADTNSSVTNIKSQAARYVTSNKDVFGGDQYADIASEDATFSQIKTGIGQANADSIAITSSEEYQRAQAKKAAMPKK